jgi:hypothetical protein
MAITLTSQRKSLTRLRTEFVSDLNLLAVDTRRLWTPANGETTTSTESSRYGATTTYFTGGINGFDIPGPIRKGDILYAHFNGTDEEADMPDANELSFNPTGQAGADEAFAIALLISPDVVNAAMTLFAKWNLNSGGQLREYRVGMDTSGYIEFEIYDENANVSIGVEYRTALTAATWTLVILGYDGSGAESGMSISIDGARVATASIGATPTSYVGMQASATVLKIAHWLNTSGAAATWFNGKIAVAHLIGRALSREEEFAYKGIVNGHADLSL